MTKPKRSDRAPRPPCKWVGGKAHAVKRFGDVILDHLEHSGGAFIEPFLGGAAMALFVGANYPKQMILGDVVEPLIEFYQELQRDERELAQSIARIALEYGLDEKAYYAVRAEEPDTAHLRAAQFLYLNRLGFNGLQRQNKSGKNNVPAGSRAKEGTATLPERRTLTEASIALRLATIECVDFEAVIDRAEERDFLYIDSPYYYSKDGFTDYSKGGFGVKDQERLALALYRAHERGAVFIAHNSLDSVVSTSGETDAGVRYWFGEWATVIPVKEPRRVSADGNRDDANCAIITNDPVLAEKLREAL